MIRFATWNFRTVLLLLSILLLCPRAWSQKDTGSIAGTVKDSSGELVVGAQVTVADVDRGLRFSTTTSDLGEYLAGPLRVGNHPNLQLAKSGGRRIPSTPPRLGRRSLAS